MEDDCIVRLSEALKRHGAIMFDCPLGESESVIPDGFIEIAGFKYTEDKFPWEYGIAVPERLLEDNKLINILSKQAERALMKGFFGI